jgi:hypothetical protein
MSHCIIISLLHFFLMGLGFELRALARKVGTWLLELHLQVHFALVILEKGVLWTICLGWPRTMFLSISASQEAKIIGVATGASPETLLIILFFKR